MVCSSCGREIPDNAQFCLFCGAAVSTSIPSADQTAVSAPAADTGAVPAPDFPQEPQGSPHPFSAVNEQPEGLQSQAAAPAKKNRKMTILIMAAVLVFSGILACAIFAIVKLHAGKSEELLPLDLTFGMTYEDFSKKLKKNGCIPPALKDAESNSGYVSESLHILNAKNYQSFDWSFLHSDTLSKNWKTDDRYYESDPALYFSFNENKELYQVVCIFNNPEVAARFFGETEEFLDAYFSIENKSADETSTRFDTERYSVYFKRDDAIEQFYYNLMDLQYVNAAPTGFEATADTDKTERTTKRPTDSELTDMLSKKVQTFNSGFSISIGEAVNNCIKNYDVTILSLAESKSEMLKDFDQSLIDYYETNYDLNNVYLTIVSGDVILAIDVPYYTEYQEKAVICIFPFDENGNHVEEHDTVKLSKEFSSSAQQYMYSTMF